MTAQNDRTTESMRLTVQLPSEIMDRLDEIATATRRHRSHLAAEAIATFVAREHAIVKAIEAGQAAVRAGDVIPHEEVMREARAIIAGAKNGR